MESIVIHRCFNDVEADQIKQLLELEGIGCQVSSDVPHSVYPFTMDGLGEIRIIVMESEAAKAQQIIEDFYSEHDLNQCDEIPADDEMQPPGEEPEE